MPTHAHHSELVPATAKTITPRKLTNTYNTPLSPGFAFALAQLAA